VFDYSIARFRMHLRIPYQIALAFVLVLRLILTLEPLSFAVFQVFLISLLGFSPMFNFTRL